MFFHRNGVSVATGSSGVKKLIGNREVLLGTTEIEISGIRADTLPSDLFSSAPQIVSLRVCDTSIRKLPAEIANLKNIRELVLTGNKLESLPPGCAALILLESLDISDNSFSEFPEIIGQLPALRNLNVSENHISAIPDCIRRMGKLADLIATDNSLTELPTCLTEMECLELIDVTGNPVHDLPRGPYPKLKHLYADPRRLTNECLEWLGTKAFWK